MILTCLKFRIDDLTDFKINSFESFKYPSFVIEDAWFV